MNPRIQRVREQRKLRFISIGATVVVFLLIWLVMPFLRYEYTLGADLAKYAVDVFKKVSQKSEEVKPEPKPMPEKTERKRDPRILSPRERDLGLSHVPEVTRITSHSLPQIDRTPRSSTRQGRQTETVDVNLRTTVPLGSVAGETWQSPELGGIGGGEMRQRGRDWNTDRAPTGQAGRDLGANLPSIGGAMTMPSLRADSGKIGDIIVVPDMSTAPSRQLDSSPIIDWIERHKRPLPETLRKPELLDERPGDVTTWTEFPDDKGVQYILYLLGRRSVPPQLNIFLASQGKGTLLRDQGVKGTSDIFKHGTVRGSPANPSVRLEELPPGATEAKRMMRVFTAWWEHTKTKER